MGREVDMSPFSDKRELDSRICRSKFLSKFTSSLFWIHAQHPLSEDFTPPPPPPDFRVLCHTATVPELTGLRLVFTTDMQPNYESFISVLHRKCLCNEYDYSTATNRIRGDPASARGIDFIRSAISQFFTAMAATPPAPPPAPRCA